MICHLKPPFWVLTKTIFKCKYYHLKAFQYNLKFHFNMQYFVCSLHISFQIWLVLMIKSTFKVKHFMLQPCVCVWVIWVLASIDPFSFKWVGLPTVLIKNKLMPFFVWFSPALKMNSEQLQVESCNPTAVNYGYNLLDFFSFFFGSAVWIIGSTGIYLVDISMPLFECSN